MSTSESTSPKESVSPQAENAAPADSAAPTPSTPQDPNKVEGPLSEDHIFEALKAVIDPELFVNIVDLGLVYTVELAEAEEDKSNVKVEMTLTSPACPAGPQIIGQSKDVINRLDPVADVEIKLVMDPPWTPDRMTEDAKDTLGIF
jgi:metal-sulfur cluster biosynthetic enzyme